MEKQTIEYTSPVSNFYTEFTKNALSDLFMIEFPMINIAEELLGTLQGKRGLDFGCGLGQLANRFTEAGAKMTGLDISPSQLEVSKKQFPHIGFTHEMTDIEEASLDFVVCKFSLCEMDTETYMKNLVQLKKKLKKGGYLIIGDHNRDVCGGKETLCEKYADISEKQDGDQVLAILKTPGTLFNEYSMTKGLDYVEITDHYRTGARVINSLETNGFSNIEVIPQYCPENIVWVPLDEYTNPVYRVSVAQN